jgi:hypothetical protein
MYRVNEDNSIYATRGDIVIVSVSAEKNGVPYTFQAGEVLRIKVYGKKDAESVVLQKDFPVTTAAQTVELFLSEEDTKIGDVISKHKDYWYEVELNPYDNPQTIIGYDEDGPCVFRLFPEGADIPEYVPDPEVIKVIDTELDMASERPVQNQVIARAFANLQAGYQEVHKAVAEKFVTPQMYGAVGDGEADDTDALQTALDSGFKIIDLLGKTYHITKPLVIHDGQIIQNGGIDGKYECTNGIECTSYSDAPQQRVSIINVSVRNFTQFGIYLKNCHDSAISRCFVENIVTDVEGNATNGMCIEFCKNTIISECTVHNVNAPDDADGIHFLHLDTIAAEVYSGNVVRNCITLDCGKRHYKIQEYGVTLDGCKMIEGALGIQASANLVSIYDSYCTVRNCWFDAICNNPVVIGSSNAEENHTYRNIVFIGNRFSLYGSNAQAAIVCADHDGNLYTDIIVTSNIFTTREDQEGALYVRENFDRILFCDNVVNGCYYAVFLRDVGDGGTLICNNNVMDGRFALIMVQNTTVASIVNVGNFVDLSQGTRIVYPVNSTITRIKSDNLCPGTIYEYPHKAGSTSMRPIANVNAGYMFYDWTLDKPIFLSTDKTTWKDGAGNAVT